MLQWLRLPLALSLILQLVFGKLASQCFTQPGDPRFPTAAQLARFNATINGRLLNVVPSAKFCQSLGGCSDAEWFDGNFRNNIIGQMLQYNWEQDYTSTPPSLCLRNSTVCGQGNVPILGVNVTTVEHIQAALRFAKIHNLKIAIKASGHDLLGRSTARNSLVIWTRNLLNVTFHNSFTVGGVNQGSTVTAGSGVGLHTLYALTKEQGKIFVGGTAASVVASGGYVQGAGHSILSPTLGLAADNALQFEIVIADGTLLTANSVSNSDLFWALRGGGAGSWGVIVSTTFRTFPSFNAVHHSAVIVMNNTDQVAQLATLHAKHIFDWDPLHPGQSFLWTASPPVFTWAIDTFFPNTTIAIATAALMPFLNAVTALGFTPILSAQLLLINDILGATTADMGGAQGILGSRLFPSSTYRNNATEIGRVTKQLIDDGATVVVGSLVAGGLSCSAYGEHPPDIHRSPPGQVSKNAHIDSAVTPKWRTAKTHMIVAQLWDDSTTPGEVEAIREAMTKNKVPLLAALAGPDSGAYSNEADVREPNFQTTFFGPNYDRLSRIKKFYDPDAIFIVPAGVGSENFDADTLCKVN
ncbi:FAD-binding domain-containing protein [Hysterangium stoloniferum]|nr:FAD-binding domain-containing protein [Hysterangium stoloniferum]